MYESPYHVGISDESQAKAELENCLTPSEGMDIKLLSPISVSLARTLGLWPNEINKNSSSRDISRLRAATIHQTWA